MIIGSFQSSVPTRRVASGPVPAGQEPRDSYRPAKKGSATTHALKFGALATLIVGAGVTVALRSVAWGAAVGAIGGVLGGLLAYGDARQAGLS